ncbi:MAG TPA: hypothetical protein VHI52_22025, partial [Verrucomicrobiae bacterium]|nr:hypothetical protein [Verrucomicrobiae bacterium]
MDAGKFSFEALKKALEEGLEGPLSMRMAKVLKLAYDGHAGQYRTTRTSEHRLPFIIHPVGVARLAIRHFPVVQNVVDDLETVVCVALAHDLIEDTRVASGEVEAAAGGKVRAYVEALTKPPAAVAGRSGAERNKRLLDQIMHGGPTTVFVKICDSMHNLGGASLTPLDLLGKTLDKARRQYLPLLNQCPLGAAVEQAYLARITEAQQRLDSEQQHAEGGRTVATLEEAIQECVGAVEGKLLELHDIAAILRQICDREQVAIWRVENRASGVLAPVIDASGFERPVQIRRGELLDSAAASSGEIAHRLGDTLLGQRCERLVTVPVRIDTKAVFLVAVGFADAGRHSWFTKEAGSVLISFLAQRLVLSEADRRGRLASEAAALGIQINPELAARVGVQPAELVELNRWRRRAEQAMSIVVHAVQERLMRLGDFIPLKELVVVESRVKPVDSILRKMLATRMPWPGYQGMEDIAGVRVVSPTQAFLSRVEEGLVWESGRMKLQGGVAEGRRDYVKNPTRGGYRAVHLIFDVETVSEGEGLKVLPCELQLRTMFQDTWAKISHGTLYKGHAPKEMLDALRQMGRALEECDG